MKRSLAGWDDVASSVFQVKWVFINDGRVLGNLGFTVVLDSMANGWWRGFGAGLHIICRAWLIGGEI